ncbi:hypothetical protein ACFQHN_25730 [Natrialbaceae archaeon GCM10025896]
MVVLELEVREVDRPVGVPERVEFAVVTFVFATVGDRDAFAAVLERSLHRAGVDELAVDVVLDATDVARLCHHLEDGPLHGGRRAVQRVLFEREPRVPSEVVPERSSDMIREDIVQRDLGKDTPGLLEPRLVDLALHLLEFGELFLGAVAVAVVLGDRDDDDREDKARNHEPAGRPEHHHERPHHVAFERLAGAREERLFLKAALDGFLWVVTGGDRLGFTLRRVPRREFVLLFVVLVLRDVRPFDIGDTDIGDVPGRRVVLFDLEEDARGSLRAVGVESERIAVAFDRARAVGRPVVGDVRRVHVVQTDGLFGAFDAVDGRVLAAVGVDIRVDVVRLLDLEVGAFIRDGGPARRDEQRRDDEKRCE